MPIATPQGTLDFKSVDKVTFVGASSNTVIDTTTGSLGVGVGVGGPTSNLHVVGNAFVSSNLIVSGNATVSSNLTVSGNVEVGTANLFVDTVNSRVGIGMASPTQKLDVSGTVKATDATLSNFLNLGTHTSAPSNPVNGSLYYNTTTNSLELYKNGWASLSAFAPTDIAGLVGWYLPQNWNGSTWVDASGSGNDSASKVGTINYSATQSGGGATNSFPILYGDTSTKINFPSAICPSTYTLIYLTRYYSSQSGRILDSQSNNWLSGHWGGKSGLAYHGGWLTQTTSDIHGSNWVLAVDQNSLFRHKSASVGWSQSTGGGGTHPHLRIGSQGYEPSNWQCAEICVYNRHLSSTEYTKVVDYMEKKFGI